MFCRFELNQLRGVNTDFLYIKNDDNFVNNTYFNYISSKLNKPLISLQDSILSVSHFDIIFSNLRKVFAT